MVISEDEAYWRLRSGIQWILEGNKNMKYFHAQTAKWRRCNKILGLEDSQGVWHKEVEQVDRIVVQ